MKKHISKTKKHTAKPVIKKSSFWDDDEDDVPAVTVKPKETKSAPVAAIKKAAASFWDDEDEATISAPPLTATHLRIQRFQKGLLALEYIEPVKFWESWTPVKLGSGKMDYGIMRSAERFEPITL